MLDLGNLWEKNNIRKQYLLGNTPVSPKSQKSIFVHCSTHLTTMRRRHINRLRIYCTTVAITAHKFRYSNHKHHYADSCWQFLLFSIIQLKERYALVFHFLVQLRPCRDVVIHHEKMKLLLPVALVDRREQHAAGLNAHHGARRQVRDRNQGLSDQLFRLVVGVDAA